MLIRLGIIVFYLCLIHESRMQPSGVLRLRDGSIAGKGRLEIFYNSQWGTVCDDDFDHKDAVVACRQIGYSTGFMVNNTLIPDGTGPIWLDDIRCSGSEDRLDNCLHSAWGVHNCGHTDDVGVECFTPVTGSLRIIEETMTMQGRLEVYYNGSWGTICDDNFEDVDALVACKQMGYSAGISLGNLVTDGSGTILLDDVGCTGIESTLTSCAHPSWGVHNCGHGEDVGVQCFIRNKVDGSWGIWSSWGSCSLTCGGGVQYRTRECNNPTPISGGNCCEGIPFSSQVCNSNVCAVNGNWGSWSSWSICSTSCGGGIANRTRVCNNPVPSNGGLYCTEDSTETTLCKTDPCPVDGNWEQWSNWSNCSENCGCGIQNRSRDCKNPFTANGGIFCHGLPLEIQICNRMNCFDTENTFEVAGQHSDSALAGVAVGCVVSTAGFVFVIQFMIRRIYKGKQETQEHNNTPEDYYEDLKKKRISGIPDNESFDILKNVSSGTHGNLPENNYENLQLKTIEARVSNIYQNS